MAHGTNLGQRWLIVPTQATKMAHGTTLGHGVVSDWGAGEGEHIANTQRVASPAAELPHDLVSGPAPLAHSMYSS